MSRPANYLVRMLIFLGVVALGVIFLGDRVLIFFEANPYLNGFILGVLFLGILNTFRLTIMLYPAVNWIRAYQRDVTTQKRPPQVLSPMAKMIRERRGRLRLTTGTMRSLLDSIGTRLDEGREISRYMIGLLVFLGLLGTFWGLMETVTAIIDVIGTLSVSATDNFQTVFNNFKEGLLASLSGAGTAFSSSLFGLAGSLVLGFLDMQAGQAQNRFYNDLEEWLSGMTRLSSLPEFEGDGQPTLSGYIQALFENLAEGMEDMREAILRGEEERVAQSRNMDALTQRLTTLTEQMRAEQGLLTQLAETQIELKPTLEAMAQQRDGAQFAQVMRHEFQLLGNRIAELQTDSATADQQIARDAAAANHELMQELRHEFQLLARTLATTYEGGRHAQTGTGQTGGEQGGQGDDPRGQDRRRTRKTD